MTTRDPKLYHELADWFHLVTHPREYAAEARYATRLLKAKESGGRPRLLELGSGGGNNASHMKKSFELTLTDISPSMLKLSRQINPECKHIVGDMRSLRLHTEFDAVYIHDAIMYIANERDLRRVAKTAAIHCKPGGLLLVQPDFVEESFKPGLERGGHDGNGRSARYVAIERRRGSSSKVDVHFTFRLTGKTKVARVVGDRHVVGIFPRATWMSIFRDAGFTLKRIIDPWKRECFLGRKQG
jgi:SAM-dependent methyltransferase